MTLCFILLTLYAGGISMGPSGSLRLQAVAGCAPTVRRGADTSSASERSRKSELTGGTDPKALLYRI
jgi:hypothetical protein